MVETYDLLGVNVAVTNLSRSCKVVDEWIKQKHKTYVCIAPVSTIMDCQDSEEYRSVINSSGMTTPDGMPLVWTGKLRGKKEISRTYGPDLMPALCDLSQDRGYKHYFYGGTQESLTYLKQRLTDQYPKLNVAGSHAPAMLNIKEKEDQNVIDAINEAQPDILWVGLGSPKQDYWMSIHRPELNVPVIIGVGAAFDFLSGAKKQAPRWVQRSGLEWLYRLVSEPKRLWRRYLIGNTRFIWLLIKDSLRRTFTKKSYDPVQ